MRMLVVSGVLLVAGVEGLALLVLGHRLVLPAAGAAVALVVLVARGLLTERRSAPAPGPQDSDRSGDLLRQWISGAETRIRWAESSRSDWDRHWRPVLARRFEISTGQRHGTDAAAYSATGRMLFGARMWKWVDPDDVVRSGDREPGPGRAVLAEILQRLEQR